MFLNSLLVCFSLISGVASPYTLTQKAETEKTEKKEVVVETSNPYENAVIYYDSELEAIFTDFKRVNNETNLDNSQTFIVRKK